MINLSIKGAIWYQGESNAGKGEDPRHYRTKMAALVNGWRNESKNREMPVYFVQLPSYNGATGWIRMREEQRLAAINLSNTGMVTTIDLPGKNIHPPHKLPVGERLANLALGDTYGKKSVAIQGPVVHKIRFLDDKVILDWRSIGKGLFVGNWQQREPLNKKSVAQLKWFEVADQTGKWSPARVTLAETDAQLVIVSNQIKHPKAVRYACKTEITEGLLYNSAGLPASPFCSQLNWLPWEDQPEKK